MASTMACECSGSGSASADKSSAKGSKGKHPKRLAGEGSGSYKRTYIFDIRDDEGQKCNTIHILYICISDVYMYILEIQYADSITIS
jgi:hypothetical protein